MQMAMTKKLCYNLGAKTSGRSGDPDDEVDGLEEKKCENIYCCYCDHAQKCEGWKVDLDHEWPCNEPNNNNN